VKAPTLRVFQITKLPEISALKGRDVSDRVTAQFGSVCGQRLGKGRGKERILSFGKA
jgi:hypothetical protein